MNKRPFQIIDEMNQADEANKTSLVALCPDMIGANTAKGGGHVTMGVPVEVIHQLMNNERIAILLVLDKQEYDRIGNES